MLTPMNRANNQNIGKLQGVKNLPLGILGIIKQCALIQHTVFKNHSLLKKNILKNKTKQIYKQTDKTEIEAGERPGIHRLSSDKRQVIYKVPE